MATVLGILVKGAGFGRIDRIVFAGIGFLAWIIHEPPTANARKLVSAALGLF